MAAKLVSEMFENYDVALVADELRERNVSQREVERLTTSGVGSFLEYAKRENLNLADFSAAVAARAVRRAESRRSTAESKQSLGQSMKVSRSKKPLSSSNERNNN